MEGRGLHPGQGRLRPALDSWPVRVEAPSGTTPSLRPFPAAEHPNAGPGTADQMPSTTTAPRYFGSVGRSVTCGRLPGGSVSSLTTARGVHGAG